MSRKQSSRIVLSLAVGLSVSPLFLERAQTQQNAGRIPPPQYVPFSPMATKGVLHYPDPQRFPNPHIAVLSIHRTNNFLMHYSSVELRDRGFVTLGMTTRCDNNEAACAPWDDIALDIKQGVTYLRKLPGITRVVLFGSSGGGATTTFYQAVAENGVSFCQQPTRVYRCSNALADLPRADAYILWDAHPGNSINNLRSLPAAVTNDADIMNRHVAPVLDPALDPFNPAHGYRPGGSTYTEAFKTRYFVAQAARMNRLIEIARERMQQIEKGSYKYTDDDAFIVPEASGGSLLDRDPSIHSSTTRPQKLLRNDGRIDDCCVVRSIEPPAGPPAAQKTFAESVRVATLKSFLSANAIKATHSIAGIDYCSSGSATVCNVQQISVPMLGFFMGGSSFIRDGEIMYDLAASKDKEYVVIEGATHPGAPCRACMPAGQAYDGRFDNTRKNGFDYAARWLNARF